MVKVRLDNQIVEAEFSIKIIDKEIFIDEEPVVRTFPGPFNIEVIEGKKTVDGANIIIEVE
ncbi:MAG: hypothetical protein K9L62_10905 [Vallitaleaceae bacterium]|nr:hypothetical protein [Vallitaleaceae bacterium]